MFWLDSLLASYETPTVVSDARPCDEIVLRTKAKHAVTMWRLHSNHLEENGEIVEKVAPGLKEIERFDVALTLTHQQKKDIETFIAPAKANIEVIPHASLAFLQNEAVYERKIQHTKAIVISRFSEIKRIDHILEAFRLVLQEVPHAILELYGIGSEEDHLRTLVTKHHLEHNVLFRGYTYEPASRYTEALFSILASKSEGFSLSILESMSMGTPVISYDIHYGPTDLITSGENGWIVPNGDYKALATKMVWMFQHKEQAIAMGKRAALHMKEVFHKEAYSKRWLDVVSCAIAKKKQKNL
ncbi:glycosyltransferase [Fictibacillus macauensis]|uniref:glycosyltransferase n=1 Tax=Fictibacillus macauensis TaxID=245160 RepID=UPI000313FDAE|nr:glycosyltransferase [Fictibacillus macauensis]